MNKQRRHAWVSILLTFSLIFTQAFLGSNFATAKGSKTISISVDSNGNLQLKNAKNWKIRKVKSSNSKILKIKKIKKSGKLATVKKGKTGNVALTLIIFNKQSKKMHKIRVKIKVKKKSVKVIKTLAIEAITQPVVTSQPTSKPTSKPTIKPTGRPTSKPTIEPTGKPSEKPVQPSKKPTSQPTVKPTEKPAQPSKKPTVQPTGKPTSNPTSQPTTPYYPSGNWGNTHTSKPTEKPAQPSKKPTVQPTGEPSEKPAQPSKKPTVQPTGEPSEKPVQPSKKPTSQPTVKPSEKPVHPSSEPVECQHNWSDWSNAEENGETRKCSLCEKEETRTHNLDEIVSYTPGTENHHNKITTMQCKNCDYNTASSVEEDCVVEWQYSNETAKDVSVCICGAEQIREHVHSDEPSDLNYEFLSSNNDGTHTLQAKYVCEYCKSEVILTKSENCIFGEATVKMNPSIHNMDNIHFLVSECTVCAYQKEEQQSCEPDGKIFYFRYLSQVYTAETCTICNYRCLQKPHFDHVLGEWEYYDKSSHRRECPCTDVREQEPHRWSDYDEILGGFTCVICNHLEVVEPHNHGYGMANKWGDKNIMMDIIMNRDAYAEIKSMSPINNPHPNPNDYCYRFDFLCFECGLGYSAYAAHEFVDGYCTCPRCGYIAQNP